MFDIGWSEMAVIMLVALVVIGPKDLPRLARTVGQWVAKGRSMAREFQRSLEDMAREAELDDVKREIEKVGSTNIKKSIEKTIDPTGDLGGAFDTNSRPSSGKAAIKASGAAPNGEAKEPATRPPEVTSEQPAPESAQTARAGPAPAPERASKPRTPAKPKAEAKPKTTAKPETEAKARSAAKPRPNARPKTTTGNASNAASSETGKAETMAEPH
jgi:sec-independent protein translocase protein TatB